MDTKQFSKCELELAPYSLRLLKLVGAIGFEPTPPQPFQTLAGLGWQPKDRDGSERNN